MNTLELEFYDAVKSKIGEKESKMLLEMMKSKVERELVKPTHDSATQSDPSSLETEITTLKKDVAEMKADVAELKTDLANLKTDVTEMRMDMAAMKMKFKKDIAGIKSQVIRWMLISWVATIAIGLTLKGTGIL